nr:hypothetical protein [Hordeum vulgare subsp. vulgare]
MSSSPSPTIVTEAKSASFIGIPSSRRRTSRRRSSGGIGDGGSGRGKHWRCRERIMLADVSLLKEHVKKWFVGMKKEINERMEYEGARAVMTVVEHATRMQIEQEARLAVEVTWMISSE